MLNPQPQKQETVVLVNANDEMVGVGEKIETHLRGDLHRAFSIFIFNANGELLLQRRAATKYHSNSLWSNTCCGHPRPQESLAEAAHRRLKEEMGFDCELKEAFTFVYAVKFDNDFSEHEYDHVLVGRYDGKPIPNPEEVDDWKWLDPALLKKDLEENAGNYTYWLPISIKESEARFQSIREFQRQCLIPYNS
jgi:isopentenyl-diphosphate delta-isomerase